MRLSMRSLALTALSLAASIASVARADVSLNKTTRINERYSVQFRAECYNAWNHPNLDNPNTTPTNSAFGAITGQSPSPRQFQLALKLTF